MHAHALEKMRLEIDMTRKEFLRIASRGTAASLAAGATIGTMAGSPAAAEPGSGSEPGPRTEDQGLGTKDQGLFRARHVVPRPTPHAADLFDQIVERFLASLRIEL